VCVCVCVGVCGHFFTLSTVKSTFPSRLAPPRMFEKCVCVCVVCCVLCVLCIVCVCVCECVCV
jgi:hypothetical protein